MQQCIFEIKSNNCIAPDIFEMLLLGNSSSITRPGQFINIRLNGLFLRRPISVCEWGDGFVRIIYKVVGRGTHLMSGMASGEKLDVLCGLGNGFDASALQNDQRPVLIGGGVGVPPMFGLAQLLLSRGITPDVVLGFRNREQIFYADKFEKLGARVHITTEDGSFGTRGFVTAALKDLDCDYYFACGPMPMLKGIHSLGGRGQLSFEERMGCGFGACMGCSCKTITGYKRICVEGPVMLSEEVFVND